ncbi:ATPase [Paenibacillus sp. TRM 82003]|nr:ATPase [Paenibacillus sp. TRM 82003]
MNYYLGVDGGGSKTLAVLCDERGVVVGRGVGGCGNHQVNEALARSSIRQAVDEALRQAGVPEERIGFTVYGLAGADREADFRILRPMMAEIGLSPHDIVCDTVIGLRAGTRQSDGVVLVCGTGTNCYGVNRCGESFQCGGFGYAFGDFGGGSDLAIEVFRTVIRTWEGRGEPTLLTEATLAALGYDSVEEMFHDFLDRGGRVPHRIAKVLFEVADRDETARSILRRQGEELGRAANATIRRLGMERDAFDLVLVGSVLTRSDGQYVLPHIEQTVRAIAPGCRLTVLSLEPAAGALLLAMERSGIEVIPGVYRQLEASLSIRTENGGADIA